MAQSYTATINPGLESTLQSELRQLGGKKVSIFNGGVTFRSTRGTLYKILQFSRCANAIRWKVDEFKAKDIREFFRKFARISWSDILQEKTVVSVNAVSHRSCVSDIRDIEKAAKDALTSQRFPIAKKGQTNLVILVRFDNDRVTVSIDIGGAAFYKRGWRPNVGRAPLRETLAASLLQIVRDTTDWDGTSLCDPMCGSGTFVIEAALASLNRSPRIDRDYSIEKLVSFDAELWKEIAKTPSLPEKELNLFGADSDEKSVRNALENASLAKLESLRFVKRNLVESCSQWDTTTCPFIITNPPYGARIKMTEFIEPLRQKAQEGARVFLLIPRDYASIGTRLASFRNGGIPVEFVELQP